MESCYEQKVADFPSSKCSEGEIQRSPRDTNILDDASDDFDDDLTDLYIDPDVYEEEIEQVSIV